jgi:gliding motility-associated-like protein
MDTSFTLAYQYNFSIDASPSVTIDLGGSTTLGYTIIGNAGNYVNVWTPSSTLSCADCANPDATPSATTTYLIQVSNDAGCVASDVVAVTVIPDHTIFIPNVFTPNGDGNNDVFEIYGKLKSLTYLEVQVFNRWGEKVFESNDHQFKWDGTFKGVLQNPAVFVYNIKAVFVDGFADKIYVGSVTLMK